MSVTAVPLQPVKRAYKVWLWIGVLAAIALAFGLAWVGTRSAVAAKLPNDQFLAWHKGQSGIQTTASGLQYQVIKPGSGPTAAEQDGVSLKIHGILRDGSDFQEAAPMRFQVGQPMIPGFTEGVKLMKKGAKYRFWLPPNLGYGAEPGGQHELADKVLIFDVEMQDLVPAAVIQQMMMQQMMQQGGGQGGPQGGPPAGGAAGPPPSER
ncbi:FKBP-type peptidyl-prolyl cis-trans isomerase [Sphingomonas sp. JC676]|uniref:FKBP-type peptidyl-prolyl cis-trans isomerase n=1 Tax=Sphingomonas sp. JC676 TaxID=2768065 RepID=UPI001658638A|nr:FKBP-type peptidyl-prolyl cis-trans isomerase [Sphingomonas sp. JC676]MBC9030922.1 FKBP-type peptidyl-prolyl cis-trans isomerase [Sphingomonas sp. JC676]